MKYNSKSFVQQALKYKEYYPLLQKLPKDEESSVFDTLVPEKKNEGLLSASQVQYVCRAGNFTKSGLSYTGALRVLKVIMGYDYL